MTNNSYHPKTGENGVDTLGTNQMRIARPARVSQITRIFGRGLAVAAFALIMTAVLPFANEAHAQVLCEDVQSGLTLGPGSSQNPQYQLFPATCGSERFGIYFVQVEVVGLTGPLTLEVKINPNGTTVQTQPYSVPAGNSVSDPLALSPFEHDYNPGSGTFTSLEYELGWNNSSSQTHSFESVTITFLGIDGAPSHFACVGPDATSPEGDNLSFTVGFYSDSDCTSPAASVPDGGDIVVSTLDGTAGASDYTAASSVSFSGLPDTGPVRTLTIATTEDDLFETNETFTVSIDSQPGASAGNRTSATGTIENDDDPFLCIADASGAEGTSPMAFDVWLNLTSDCSSQVIVVHNKDVGYSYETSASGASATAGTDYTAIPTTSDPAVDIPSGTLALSGGSVTTVDVSILDETDFELDETFGVVLSAVSNAREGDFTALGTIENDDDPFLCIADAAGDENAGPIEFDVWLNLTSNCSSPVIVVHDEAVGYSYETDGTGTATAGTDYTAVATTAAVGIAAGSLALSGGSAVTVSVAPVGDGVFEEDETFGLLLSNVSNALEGDYSAVGTINNDDPAPIPADYGDAPGDGDTEADGDYDLVTRAPNGAAHLGSGVFLGYVRDIETEAQNLNASALGDDLDGDPDDEDGVTFSATTTVLGPVAASKAGAVAGTYGLLIPGSTASATVRASAAGYLNVFVDGAGGAADGDFADAGEHVVVDLPVAAGANTATFAVPQATASGDVIARFRITAAPATTTDGIGLEPTGEVEDYLLVVSSNASATVTPPGGGSVSLVGGNVVITDAAGNVVFSGPASSINSLVLEGSSGDDTFTLDWGVVEGVANITVNLGDGFDTLVIDQGVGTPDTITYNHASATDGTIVDNAGNTITFTGLDPIFDNLDVANRVFTFSVASETITLSASGDGASNNGYSFIDSDVAEQVTFVNPTSSLTINTGDGNNTVVLGSLDTPVAGTFAGITVNGGTGTDVLTVTPASYPVAVDGAAPVGTCPGDALILGGSATVATFTNVAGTGSYTFSSGEEPITFTGIESVGDADIAVTVNIATLTATQEIVAGQELVITATNNGSYDANCVGVAISAQLDDWLNAGYIATPSAGSSLNGTGSLWSIDQIVAGASATLTITGFVVPNAPQAVSFTSNAAQDVTASNNAASLTLSFGFAFPAKTHVNAALYYEKTTTAGAYDALIVGLYQGAPGITGAVWCKIPDGAVGSWPTIPAAAIGNQWRSCSEGLPFPLHVNDLFEDTMGNLWLATWGNAGLYKSSDGGETWTDVEPVLGPKQGWASVYTIVEDSAGGILYISANNGLVFRSLNGGTSWQQVASLPGASADTPWSMAVHPSISGTIYAGTFGNGVFVSEDYGFTWSELTDNDALLDLDASGDDFAGHIFDLEFSPDNDCGAGNDDCDLYAGTGNGVWRGNVGSGTIDWVLMGPDLDPGADLVLPEVRTLTFAPNAGVNSADPAQDDDLLIGTWGSGVFIDLNPGRALPLGSGFNQLALRGSQITFVAVAPTGGIFVGSTSGATAIVTASAATSTASEPEQTQLPEGYALSQNYPNPFNPVTTIGFALPETGRVKLSVFDTLGREVAVLVDGQVQAGQHEVQFSAAGLPTGTYLYRLDTGAGAIARTLILMK